MLRFDAPYFLLLLLLLITPIWHILHRRSFGEIIFGSTICLPKTKITWRVILARLLPFSYLLSLILIITAMAKPQSVLSTVNKISDAIAIEVVIDISGSMDTTTTNNISRLDMAKISSANFIKKRENDLIGLITFSGYVSTKSPLTANHDILLQLIKTVSTSHTDNSTCRKETLTALGDAITTACARLKTAKPESKIIILMTDGISNAGLIPPLQAAQISEKLHIKIYPVTLNTPTDKSSPQYILLSEIADKTGGQLFNAGNQEELTAILNEIDSLEKTEIKTSHLLEKRNYSRALITVALMLILISVTLNISITRRLI